MLFSMVLCVLGALRLGESVRQASRAPVLTASAHAPEGKPAVCGASEALRPVLRLDRCSQRWKHPALDSPGKSWGFRRVEFHRITLFHPLRRLVGCSLVYTDVAYFMDGFFCVFVVVVNFGPCFNFLEKFL